MLQQFDVAGHEFIEQFAIHKRPPGPGGEGAFHGLVSQHEIDARHHSHDIAVNTPSPATPSQQDRWRAPYKWPWWARTGLSIAIGAGTVAFCVSDYSHMLDRRPLLEWLLGAAVVLSCVALARELVAILIAIGVVLWIGGQVSSMPVSVAILLGAALIAWAISARRRP